MSREQIIRDTAYAIWEAEGKPEGRDAEHWRLAENRIAASTGQPAKEAKPVKGRVSASATHNAKAAAPVKKAATGNKGASKSATKAKA